MKSQSRAEVKGAGEWYVNGNYTRTTQQATEPDGFPVLLPVGACAVGPFVASFVGPETCCLHA